MEREEVSPCWHSKDSGVRRPFSAENEEDHQKVDLSSQLERKISNIVPRQPKKDNDFNVKEKSMGDRNAPVFCYPLPYHQRNHSSCSKRFRVRGLDGLCPRSSLRGWKVDQPSSWILIYNRVPFSMRFSPPIDNVVAEMCIRYNLFLA